jgi:hypothetical protein
LKQLIVGINDKEIIILYIIQPLKLLYNLFICRSRSKESPHSSKLDLITGRKVGLLRNTKVPSATRTLSSRFAFGKATNR